MKKLLAFVLVMTIILSLSVAAYAAPSPTKGTGSSSGSSSSSVVVSSVDLPARTSRSVSSDDSRVTIITNDNLTAEQRATVDEAISVVTGDGALPVDSYLILVDGEGQGFVIVELNEGEVVYVVYGKDNFSKFGPSDLESVGGNLYKVPVDPGVATLIIAKEK